MKRFLILIVSIISVFSLIACESPVTNDFQATVVFEEVTIEAITVHAVITEDMTSLDALAFIANELAVDTYQKHIETIALNAMTLTVYLYDSTASYNAESDTYGFMVFNLNAENTPGVSHANNQLTLGA